MVRFLTGVETQVGLEVAFLVKRLVAVVERTHEVAHAVVLFQVHLQPLLPTVRLLAARNRTDKVFLGFVRVFVVAQVTLRHERLVAPGVLALKRPILLQLRPTKS